MIGVESSASISSQAANVRAVKLGRFGGIGESIGNLMKSKY